ncbi:MAG: response regulator [Peptococcaceae bacterium]|nr:response regulator [Peptococcaceae bacterium]
MARILVVEDNPMIGMVMQIALSDEGHEIDILNCAVESLKVMENGKIPDLVFTDLNLKGVNGCELIRKMRCNKRLNHIPAVIITGDIPSPDILPHEDEYQGLLIKPFDLREVTGIVAKLIQHTAAV